MSCVSQSRGLLSVHGDVGMGSSQLMRAARVREWGGKINGSAAIEVSQQSHTVYVNWFTLTCEL